MNSKRKEKIGDWLLDIGKYMATAILLSELFSDVDGYVLYIVIGITTVIIVSIGLYLSGKE